MLINTYLVLKDVSHVLMERKMVQINFVEVLSSSTLQAGLLVYTILFLSGLVISFVENKPLNEILSNMVFVSKVIMVIMKSLPVPLRLNTLN